MRNDLLAEHLGVQNDELEAAVREAGDFIISAIESCAPIVGRENVPEGLAVLSMPEHHRRRLRTSNPRERAVQQEIKRRTSKVRVFPNDGSLKRLVSVLERTTSWPPRQGPHRMGMPG